MDDVADAVLVDHPLDLLEVRDVAAHERHALDRVRSHDELNPGGIVADVEADDGRSLVREDLARPGPEAAERTRHEEDV